MNTQHQGNAELKGEVEDVKRKEDNNMIVQNEMFEQLEEEESSVCQI